MKLLTLAKEFGVKTMEVGAKNSPTILAGLAAAGAITTAIVAMRAGIKAKDILEEHRKKIDEIEQSAKLEEEGKTEEAIKEQVIDTAKKLAPIVAPVAAVAIVTAGCALGSNTINLRRQAVLTAAFELAQANCIDQQNYISEAKKLIGVKDDIEAEKKAIEKEKEKIADPTNYVYTSEDIWVRDLVYGVKFKSSRVKIREAFLNTKEAILDRGEFESVSDLYENLGMKAFERGNKEGWNPEDVDFCFPTFGTEFDEDHNLVLTFKYQTFANNDDYILRSTSTT